MKRIIYVLVLISLFITCYTVVHALSLASLMASIDGNSNISRYDNLLRTLERKTTSSQQEIGDMTANAKMVYEKDFGRKIKLITIMEGVNDSIPSGSKKQDYAELAGIYITILGSRR